MLPDDKGKPRDKKPTKASKSLQRKRESRKTNRWKNNEPLIVGVGASEGSLQAFTQLLRHLSKGPGLALVLVQHLAPN